MRKLRLRKGTVPRKGQRRLELAPLTTLPPAPDHLTAEAAEKYREVGSMLVEAGVLAGADIDVLASYCAAWARAVEAEHEISRGGAVITYSTGIVGPSPWCKVLREALRRMDIAGDQLGIGPRSRASLAVPLKEPADPLKAFLHQASGA